MGSNAEWVNPHEPEAEITRMKDGRTTLAYKAEHAGDMERRYWCGDHAWRSRGRYHGGRDVAGGGEAVAKQIAEPTPNGKFKVNAKGVEELVADKDCHSGDVLGDLQDLRCGPILRNRIADGGSGRAGGSLLQPAADRWQSGKQLLRRRGELVERTFAHTYETGTLRRLYVRGKQTVHKWLLLQTAACNLARWTR